jgi:hypothetical protein
MCVEKLLIQDNSSSSPRKNFLIWWSVKINSKVPRVPETNENKISSIIVIFGFPKIELD